MLLTFILIKTNKILFMYKSNHSMYKGINIFFKYNFLFLRS